METVILLNVVRRAHISQSLGHICCHIVSPGAWLLGFKFCFFYSPAVSTLGKSLNNSVLHFFRERVIRWALWVAIIIITIKMCEALRTTLGTK